MGSVDAQQGNYGSDYGVGGATKQLKFKLSWLRRLYQAIKGVDPGATPIVDTNADFNLFGVQPVAIATTVDYPLHAQLVNNTSGGSAISASNPLQVASSPPANIVNTGATGQNVGDGATVYTVTTGKTFYCTGMMVGNNAGAAKTQTVSAGATQVWSGQYTATGTVGNHDVIASPTPIFSAASTTAITISGGGAGANVLVLWGYEI